MESHNARPDAPADAPLERAARLSRYALRLVEADPSLALDAGVDRAFSAGEMRSALAALPADTEDALQSALRVLRRRVMLRLIARDLSGLAPLEEVMTTATALAEVTLTHALARLDEQLSRQHGRPVGAESGREQQLHVVG